MTQLQNFLSRLNDFGHAGEEKKTTLETISFIYFKISRYDYNVNLFYYFTTKTCSELLCLLFFNELEAFFK